MHYLFFITTSCSHLNTVKENNFKKIIEVELTDNQKHQPLVGQSVKIFNLNTNTYKKRTRNGEYVDYSRSEKPVVGRIITVISNEKIMVELDEDYVVTERTRAEY